MHNQAAMWNVQADAVGLIAGMAGLARVAEDHGGSATSPGTSSHFCPGSIFLEVKSL